MHNPSYNVEWRRLQDSGSITALPCFMAVKLPNDMETARANRCCRRVWPEPAEDPLVSAMEITQQRILPCKRSDRRGLSNHSRFRAIKSWKTLLCQQPVK